MSKNTKARILSTALRLFNERGMHNVGVREIARELEISPGNLQYHFNKKDDLVAALVEERHAENTRLMRQLSTPGTFAALREIGMTLMRHHIEYRALLLGYPGLVAHSPSLRALERRLEPLRRERWGLLVASLVANGLVNAGRLEPHADALFEQVHHLGRNWLFAAVLTHEAEELEAAAAHHFDLVLALWRPYVTPAGEAELTGLLGPEA